MFEEAGKVVVPERGSDTFISTIGHLDGRIDLYKNSSLVERASESASGGRGLRVEIGNLALMDLCIMASKLAYENAKVIRNVVNHPFDADDWSTDFDYSWYEIPKLGKVHMGFLEALGLGNRADTSTFHNLLRVNRVDITTGPSEGLKSLSSLTESNAEKCGRNHSSNHEELANNGEKKLIPEMVEMTAYFSVRSKLKSLLNEHKTAKFVVTGHSLGGALAILFPTVLLLHEERELMQKLLGVYTYGQPRVGNRQLGRFMEAHLDNPVPKYFRVVYSNDLVPRLPYDDRTFLYKHFGECLYYNSLYIEKGQIDIDKHRRICLKRCLKAKEVEPSSATTPIFRANYPIRSLISWE
ncbi:hypothetical protein U1Q18_006304 [Sarracenia purpurea var. burkii]